VRGTQSNGGKPTVSMGTFEGALFTGGGCEGRIIGGRAGRGPSYIGGTTSSSATGADAGEESRPRLIQRTEGRRRSGSERPR